MKTLALATTTVTVLAIAFALHHWASLPPDRATAMSTGNIEAPVAIPLANHAPILDSAEGSELTAPPRREAGGSEVVLPPAEPVAIAAPRIARTQQEQRRFNIEDGLRDLADPKVRDKGTACSLVLTCSIAQILDSKGRGVEGTPGVRRTTPPREKGVINFIYNTRSYSFHVDEFPEYGEYRRIRVNSGLVDIESSPEALALVDLIRLRGNEALDLFKKEEK